MVMNKGAQFFILAAVIISAIVISFAFTANEARVNQEPENFRDLTYEVKKETGAVMDYQVYTGFSDDSNLSEFVEKLADDFYEGDSDVNIMFIYGNSSNVTFKNYGARGAKIGNDNVKGGYTPITGTVTDKGTGIGQKVNASLEDYDPNGNSWTKKYSNVEYVEVEVSGQKFNVSFSENKQVIFIIQKEVGDENYLSVK